MKIYTVYSMWTKIQVSFIEPYVFNSPLIKVVSVPLNPTIQYTPPLLPPHGKPLYTIHAGTKNYKYWRYFSATNCLFLARFPWDSYRDNNIGGHVVFWLLEWLTCRENILEEDHPFYCRLIWPSTLSWHSTFLTSLLFFLLSERQVQPAYGSWW